MTTARPRPFLSALCLLTLLSLLPCPPAGAQAASEGTPFFEQVDVNVVNVEVFVTDKRGRPVTGLTKDDFELTVDGRPTAITNFYAEEEDQAVTAAGLAGTPEPLPEAGAPDSAPALAAAPGRVLRLLVFIDETALQPLNRKRSFKHVRRFLEKGLAPEDEVAVVSLSPGLKFHADFTRDREVVSSILEELQRRPAQDMGSGLDRRRALAEITDGYLGRPGGGGAPAEAALNVVRAVAATEYQLRRSGAQALAALVDTLAGVPGRKAVLHVSDGLATNPGEDLFITWQNKYGESDRSYQTEIGNYDLIPQFQELAQRANASGVTFYGIDADPPDYGHGRSAEFQGDPNTSPSFTTEAMSTYEANKRATVELVAFETGGRRVIANGRLVQQLNTIGSDFETFYSLGFEGGPRSQDRRHEVKVRLKGKRKGLVVRHRTGYQDQSPDLTAANRTMAALLYGVLDDPLGVEAAAGEPAAREDGATVLPVAIEIPFDQLALLPQGETRAATLSLFVTVQAASGATRPVQKVPVELRLPEENVEQAQGQKARYVLPVVLQPDDRTVALGVRDDVAGIVSTLRLDVAAAAPSGKSKV